MTQIITRIIPKTPLDSTLLQKIKYTTINKRSSSKQVFQPWKLILCSTGGGQDTIKKIQQALVNKGYFVTINNIFDQANRDTLLQFQKDHGLRVGYLDVETLELLGVEEFKIDWDGIQEVERF